MNEIMKAIKPIKSMKMFEVSKEKLVYIDL